MQQQQQQVGYLMHGGIRTWAPLEPTRDLRGLVHVL